MIKVFRNVFLLCFIVINVQAGTLTESFLTSQRLGSSQMVWNISLGELHPPLQIEGWNDGAGANTTLFSVGDGRHGAFTLSRYAVFDSDGVINGGVIEIDTDDYPNLQFTVFNLEAGYEIRPVGSMPLTIRSQSSVTINGIINCSGDDGSSAIAGSPAVSVSGGSGRCGGARGGASVVANASVAAANHGVAGGPDITAGQAGEGDLLAGAAGGGGGGAYSHTVSTGNAGTPNPTNAEAVGTVPGVAGTVYRDDSFEDEEFGVGSGGGGGSGYDDPGNAPDHSSGSGGGAGGGFIQIFSVTTIDITGSVLADGGDGGAVAGTLRGGGGGGGGGGSIRMSAGDDITINAGGIVRAGAGAGASSTGGNGGNGCVGRTWLVGSFGDPNIVGGTLNPPRYLVAPGDVRFETGQTYTVESSIIDLGNTRPTITTLPITVSDPSTLGTYIYGLSFNNEPADFPAYQVSTTFLNQEVSGYAKFRIVATNGSSTNPIRIQDLTMNYNEFLQDEFNLVAACGIIDRANNQGQWVPTVSLYFTLFLLLIPMLIIGYLRSPLSTKT